MFANFVDKRIIAFPIVKNVKLISAVNFIPIKFSIIGAMNEENVVTKIVKGIMKYPSIKVIVGVSWNLIYEVKYAFIFDHVYKFPYNYIEGYL